MKKTYMTPAVQTQYVAVCQMVAASAPKIGLDKNGSVDAGDLDVKQQGEWDIFDYSE